MRLAVHRWHGVNAGDEAAQWALAQAFGDDVDWVSLDLWEPTERAIETVNACDGLVVGGGTILGNIGTWLLRADVASALRVPIGLFGTGIRDEGRPTIDDAFRVPLAALFARAHPRGVRGPCSVELLRTAGAGCPAAEVMGDSALLLDPSTIPPSDRDGIGVNLRVRRDGAEQETLAMYRRYFDGPGRALAPAVRFFACDREWDPRAAAAVWGPIEPYRDPAHFLAWIGARRLVVSERLHGAILAHVLGVPAVLIAYERKCWDYARSIGLVTSCVAPGDDRGLATAIANAAADLTQAQPAIARRRQALHDAVGAFRTRVERSSRRRPVQLPAAVPPRPGDGRTLIGLLMIRDEEDVLAETLRNHVRFCDAIFVLDGSEGAAQRATERIVSSCPAVREYWRDGDLGLPLPLRDGARQFLLERARDRFGRGNWYAILHGDELWGDDPRPYVSAMPADCDAMAVRLYHFFPHPSQRATWNYGTDDASAVAIEDLAVWYMLPPIGEHRVFWDAGHADFDAARHSCTVPQGLRPWQSECVVKQYNYRSPARAVTRARQRARDAWQRNHYQHLLAGADGFFRETLEMPDAHWAASVPLGTGVATNTGVRPLPVWRNDADRGGQVASKTG